MIQCPWKGDYVRQAEADFTIEADKMESCLKAMKSYALDHCPNWNTVYQAKTVEALMAMFGWRIDEFEDYVENIEFEGGSLTKECLGALDQIAPFVKESSWIKFYGEGEYPDIFRFIFTDGTVKCQVPSDEWKDL